MARRTRRATRRLLAALIAGGVLAAAILSSSCAPRPRDTQAPSEVTTPSGEVRPARVLLADDAETVRLAVTGPYSISLRLPSGKAKGGPSVLAQGASLPACTARATANALIVGDRHFPDAAVAIACQEPGSLSVDGRRYRGDLVLRRSGPDKLSAINLVLIDDYLYGVLGSETYAAWPPAAVEAQAIAARSYAMWRMADRRDGAFDLYASSQDQNYQGMAKEDPRLAAAVDRTAGLVLLYQMRLFRCYYHSTCGGSTESVENVFPDPPLLPLSAVPCSYCRGSKHFAWTREIPKAELAESLRAKGLSVPQLVSLEASQRTECRRVQEVAIETGRGTVTIPASTFRLAVGPSRLPSTFFDIEDKGASIEFQGHGWGHGVGMCQWGAKGMAEANYTAAEILRHYYPGSELRRLYERRGS